MLLELLVEAVLYKGGAKWNTGLRATAHTCTLKQPPLGQTDTFVHIEDKAVNWECALLEMVCATPLPCPALLWIIPPRKDSCCYLTKRRKAWLAQTAELLGPTYRDDSCSHKDWLSIHLDIISRVQLLFQFLASLGIGRTSENAPSGGTFMVQQEQHILRESSVICKNLILYPVVCVYYPSHN